MFTAKEAREKFENRYMMPVFAIIKLSIANNSNFATFINESTGYYGDKLTQRQIDVLLNLGYKVEEEDVFINLNLSIPGWRVSW